MNINPNKLRVGDMVKHMYKSDVYPRGTILSFDPSMGTAMIQWGNGDILTCPLEELELLGWNLYGGSDELD